MTKLDLHRWRISIADSINYFVSKTVCIIHKLGGLSIWFEANIKTVNTSQTIYVFSIIYLFQVDDKGAMLHICLGKLKPRMLPVKKRQLNYNFAFNCMLNVLGVCVWVYGFISYIYTRNDAKAGDSLWVIFFIRTELELYTVLLTYFNYNNERIGGIKLVWTYCIMCKLRV